MSRVLVVEDDDSIRALVGDLLAAYGYRVTSVADGASSLEAMRLATPDLVVLDLMMPGIDGLEVLRRIRADADLRRVPVIILTALTDHQMQWAGWNGGCDYYLTKPFDIDELLSAVLRFAPPVASPV